MVQWTVLLKTPTGLEYYAVEADTAEWGDDGRLTFSNVEAFPELIDAVKQVIHEDTTPDDLTQELMRLIRTAGRMVSASFQSDLVGGFFNTERAKLVLKLQENQKQEK